MKSPRRRSVLALLGVSAIAAAAVPVLTIANGAAPLAPDLRADPPENISQPELYQTATGIGAGRLLVRFDGFVTNVGQGPIEISGNPQVTGNAGLHQRAASTWGPGGTPEQRQPDRGDPAGLLRDRGRAQPLPPQERDALLAVEQLEDGAGGAGVEGRLLPLRHPAALERAGDDDEPELHRGRHELLRPGQPGRDVPQDGHLARLARRLQQVALVPVGGRLRHLAGHVLRGQRRRPGQPALGGRRQRRDQHARLRQHPGDRPRVGAEAALDPADRGRQDHHPPDDQVRRAGRLQPAVQDREPPGPRHPRRGHRGALHDLRGQVHAGARLRRRRQLQLRRDLQRLRLPAQPGPGRR